jgi:hypothetical protein
MCKIDVDKSDISNVTMNNNASISVAEFMMNRTSLIVSF